MTKPVSLAELEQVSMPLATKQARDYWQTGAGELGTLKENVSAYDHYRIRTRVMRDVSVVDLSPTKPLFGRKFRVPIGFAPSAFHQLATDEGEVATGKAAQSHNWPMGLSSYANRSSGDVKEVAQDSAVFFQLYVFKNRKTTEELVKRVEAQGYKALLLTVDTPFIGRRHADLRNNFKLPAYAKLGNFPEDTSSGPIDIGVEPQSESRRSANGEEDEQSAGNVIAANLTWAETIPWLRSISNLEIWAKGVATAEDTEEAIAAGVDGIWVSNHGGRQLDCTLPTIESLPEVVEAARGRIPVHLDGGIRKGADVFKALALGADFVWIGRPVIWGLQYDGQAGVELVQDILEEDFKYTMYMAGTINVAEINRQKLVRVGPAYQKL